ncbi:hypothetical protein ACOI22_15390 [Glaciecola sp. 2405UD65-10]|uniref:hypothetical protein n=1 Tax=Glaciecola sp. 2405UD65-10 TaxID=3397244 RepID=UPI003B5A964B
MLPLFKALQTKHLALLTVVATFTSTQLIAAPKSQSISTYKKSDACPAKFYDVSLPENGKLCQVFAADLPASLTLFVPQAPTEVLSYYTQGTKQFTSSEQIKKRYVLRSIDSSTTLIISKDGQGSQVDILVTSLHKS